MSIRCAVCGSKNVRTEIKKEGYDVKKGVIGSIMVGRLGALAGAGGKSVTYYHCADCGQVLNHPMNQMESSQIDRWLQSPNIGVASLRQLKQEYKNIEWEDTYIENSKENYIKNVKSKIIEYLQLNAICTWEEIDAYLQKEGLDYFFPDSERKCIMAYDYWKELLETGRIKQTFDRNDSILYYQLLTNPDDIIEERKYRKGREEETKFWYEHCEKVAMKIVSLSRSKTSRYYEEGKEYSYEEFAEIVGNIFSSTLAEKKDDCYFMKAFVDDILNALANCFKEKDDKIIFVKRK